MKVKSKEELENMSLSEIQTYKKNLYAANKDNISRFKTIARTLGKNLHANYGPKYEFKQDNIRIYLDDYGHYLTIHDGDKLVVSTHNEKLYAPGEWEKIINNHEEAYNKELKKLADNITKEKEDLINSLS